MSYGRLFTLVGAVLMIPLTFLLYLQVSAANTSLDFNQKESYGIEAIEPARQMLTEVGLRRLSVVAQLLGVDSAAADVAAKRSEIDQLATSLQSAAQKNARSLATSDGQNKVGTRAQEIARAWQELAQNTSNNVKDLDAKHRDLQAMLTDYIANYAGNYSNLALDPDLDSYWLMDSYCNRLGALTLTAANIGEQALELAKSRQPTTADKVAMAGTIALASDLAAALRTNFETSFANTSSTTLRPELQSKVQDTMNVVDQFLASMRTDFLEGDGTTVQVTGILQAGTTVLQSNQQLHAAVAPQLDALIMKRVRSYEAARLGGLAAGFAALLLIAYIMLSFYFQVASELTSKISEAEDLRGKAEADVQALNANIMDLLTFVADCADGDLTQRAKVTEGALGNVADALNQMMDNWNQVLGTLLKSIEETTAAGQRISQAAESMASGATSQVQQLDGATHSVMQIRGNITHVSDNAATAVTAASRTQESAFNGAEMVQRIAEEMDTLRSNVQAGAKKIKNLGDRSMEITGIVGTIAKISEQTNMLALNAAIEAARAGEHGRGFSVVAEEVRKLAERTSMATQDIRNLITSIQAETSESVAAIEEQTRAVEHHAESVAMSGEVLQKIQHESTQTSELIADMNRTAKDQVPVAEQTLQSMVAVTEIARSTQESAQETLKLSQELGANASRLVGAVSAFRIATS